MCDSLALTDGLVNSHLDHVATHHACSRFHEPRYAPTYTEVLYVLVHSPDDVFVLFLFCMKASRQNISVPRRAILDTLHPCTSMYV